MTSLHQARMRYLLRQLAHTSSAPFDAGKIIPYSKDIPYGEAKVITSRLSTKSQTTIPQPIRAALHLKEGDELLYQIEGERVILSKAQQKRAADDPFRTFSEWDSAADKKAYGNL
jgi:antitoxin PrlF